MNGDKIDSLYDSMFDKIIEAGFEFEPAPTGAGSGGLSAEFDNYYLNLYEKIIFINKIP